MRRVVLVKSCQRFRDRQEACRQTWAGELGLPLWFIEGGHESTRFTDCWLLTDTGDDYGSNSIKLREALRLLLRYDPFDQVFICDDDTFIHPQRFKAFEPNEPFIGLAAPPKIWWWHGGGGGWFSRQCCQHYVDDVTRECSWDDRLFSEVLRRHGIEITNRPDLFSQWPADRVSRSNTLITCHKVEPGEQIELFNGL